MSEHNTETKKEKNITNAVEEGSTSLTISLWIEHKE